MDHLSNDSLHIFMEDGIGNKKRCIDICQLYAELGLSLSLSLPGFHALTGCDYNPSFFKRGKKKPFKILKKNIEYQEALKHLRKAYIFERSTEVFEIIEKFVCEIYGSDRRRQC